MKSILGVENLRKTFGKKVAVQKVSFGMKEGEVVGLLALICRRKRRFLSS